MEIFFISALSILVAVVLAQREEIKYLKRTLEVYEWHSTLPRDDEYPSD